MTAVKILVLVVGGLIVCLAVFVSYAWRCATYQADALDGDLRAYIDGDPQAHEDQAIALTQPPPDRHRDDLGHTAAQRRAGVAYLEQLLTDHAQEAP